MPSGYSAAELLGASCGPRDAPVEVTVPGAVQRAHPGLRVHRDTLAADEIVMCGQWPVTSPLRTAYDLARANADDLTEAVARAVQLADARSGSPMETRVRMLLVLAGLPMPQVQYPVVDERARTVMWLDMAYPEHRVGIEYEGDEHVRPECMLRDISRYTRLVDDGWRMYRFTKREVYGDPAGITEAIERALGLRIRKA